MWANKTAHWWGFYNVGILGNVEFLFIAIDSSPLYPGLVSLDGVLSMGQIELLHLNWIELFEIELFYHLTMCKQVTDFELLERHGNTWDNFTFAYLWKIELIEIELFDHFTVCIYKIGLWIIFNIFKDRILH